MADLGGNPHDSRNIAWAWCHASLSLVIEQQERGVPLPSPTATSGPAGEAFQDLIAGLIAFEKSASRKVRDIGLRRSLKGLEEEERW